MQDGVHARPALRLLIEGTPLEHTPKLGPFLTWKASMKVAGTLEGRGRGRTPRFGPCHVESGPASYAAHPTTHLVNCTSCRPAMTTKSVTDTAP